MATGVPPAHPADKNVNVSSAKRAAANAPRPKALSRHTVSRGPILAGIQRKPVFLAKIVAAATMTTDMHSKSCTSAADEGHEKFPGRSIRIAEAAAEGAVVLTLTLIGVAAVPFVGALAGDTTQLDSAGAPEHANDRLPLTPPVGARFRA